jgi:hypothetical protein
MPDTDSKTTDSKASEKAEPQFKAGSVEEAQDALGPVLARLKNIQDACTAEGDAAAIVKGRIGASIMNLTHGLEGR